MKNYIKKLIQHRNAQKHANLLFQVDEPFSTLYANALLATGSEDVGDRRKARHNNLVQFLKFTDDMSGEILECGAYKGLSSYLMCSYINHLHPNYKGENFHIVDSFEGLSEPSEEDFTKEEVVREEVAKEGMRYKVAGYYSSSERHLRKVLSDYSQVNIVKGWIPNILSSLTDAKYKFIHIDLDIYEPTKGAAEYFYPKLVSGGVIICDDYGSLYWPGARKAINEVADLYNAKVISLASGQSVLIKI